MRPLHWLVVGIALITGAAVGGALDAKLNSGSGVRIVTRSRTEKVIARVQPPASPRRPAPVPKALPGGPDPHRIKLSDAVPADGELTGAWYPAAHQLLVQWDRDFEERPPYAEFGLTLYQYDPTPTESRWRRVWSLRRTQLDRVVALRPPQVGDFTGDGRADFIVFVDTGGTAGCGTYRAFVDAGPGTRRVLLSHLCLDQGQIVLRRGRLVVTHGVGFAGPGPHCCYRKTLLTTLGWDGRRLAVLRRRLRPNRPGAWPPG